MTQILIDIAQSTMRVYQAAAAERGYANGQALISALLADWPAILAPAVHVDDITPIIPAISTQRVWVGTRDDKLAQDNPFGGGS